MSIIRLYRSVRTFCSMDISGITDKNVLASKLYPFRFFVNQKHAILDLKLRPNMLNCFCDNRLLEQTDLAAVSNPSGT